MSKATKLTEQLDTYGMVHVQILIEYHASALINLMEIMLNDKKLKEERAAELSAMDSVREIVGDLEKVLGSYEEVVTNDIKRLDIIRTAAQRGAQQLFEIGGMDASELLAKLKLDKDTEKTDANGSR